MYCEICGELECTCWCEGCGLPPMECVCDMTEEDFEQWTDENKKIENQGGTYHD